MELRSVARSHIIGWRKDMESRNLSAATILRKLSALSSLFDYLCESRRRQSSRRRKAARRPTATKAAHRPWAAGSGTQTSGGAGGHAQGRTRSSYSRDPAQLAPRRRKARSMIRSPLRALFSMLTSKASAGSARKSGVYNLNSSSAVPQIGQLTRHPFIQLRSRAPRVTGFASWRRAQG